jgi:hypothetical protein
LLLNLVCEEGVLLLKVLQQRLELLGITFPYLHAGLQGGQHLLHFLEGLFDYNGLRLEAAMEFLLLSQLGIHRLVEIGELLNLDLEFIAFT